MAKQRIIELEETKGEYKLRGFIKGVFADNFYKTGVSQKGTDYRTMKFGVQVDEDSTVYLELFESKPKDVYFYKKSDVKGEKGTTKTVPYSNAKTFNEAGFAPIGMSNFIEIDTDANGEPVKDDKGKIKNKNVTLNNYDAVEYLSKKLIDEQPVFVLGKPTFSSYKKTVNGEDEIVRQTRFTPEKIMNSQSVDFTAEDFKSTSDFRQTFIFTGVTLDTTDKDDEKAIVEGKVVNYSSIEDVEFVLRNKKLFKSLKTKVKPYTAMTVFGTINSRVELDEIDDEWGEADPFAKKFKNFIREMEITGVDPNTFDTEGYTRQKVDKALEIIANQQRAKQEFGEKTEVVTEDVEDWGTSNTDDDWE